MLMNVWYGKQVARGRARLRGNCAYVTWLGKRFFVLFKLSGCLVWESTAESIIGGCVGIGDPKKSLPKWCTVIGGLEVLTHHYLSVHRTVFFDT